MISNTPAQNYLFGRSEYDAADLFTISLAAGDLIVTTWDTAILGATPAVIERGTFRASMTGDVGIVDITIHKGGVKFQSQELAALALAGAFDDRPFVAERVLDPAGAAIRVPRFTGHVDQAEPVTTGLRIIAKDLRAKLDRPIPARVYQTSCPYRYKGPDCGAISSNPTCAKTPAACAINGNFPRYGGQPHLTEG